MNDLNEDDFLEEQNLMLTICAFIIAWQTENNEILDVDLDIMQRSMATLIDKDIQFKTGMNEDGRYEFELSYVDDGEN